MKTVILVLIVLLGACWASLNQHHLKAWWQGVERHFDRFEKLDEPALSETAPAPSTPVSQPAPAKEATPPPPAPVPPPTLADGVFYTLERISQTTEAGVKSIGPGVKVTQVGEENGMLLVDAGGTRILAPRSKLSNNTVEVAALLRTIAEPSHKESPPPPSSTTPDAVEKAARDAKRRELQAQLPGIKRQLISLRNEITRLNNEAVSMRARGRPSTYNERTIAGLRSQMNALEAQRSRIEYELATLPK